MSKTFETNALKGKSLAAGMKRRIAELGKYGGKLQEANEQLNSLRDRAAVYRKIIKQNYLQEQWAGFGLQDKR